MGNGVDGRDGRSMVVEDCGYWIVEQSGEGMDSVVISSIIKQTEEEEEDE